MSFLKYLPQVCVVLIGLACGSGDKSGKGVTVPNTQSICSGYPEEATSPWVLPYPIGVSHVVGQANCNPLGSHQGPSRYAYDFRMPIGARIVASRSGTVTEVVEHFEDGVDMDLTQANLVRLEHADGTIATYAHLMQDGVVVELGEFVEQGRVIAKSGNTGRTGSLGPHLHFHVRDCPQNCESHPITFRNADPDAPNGLQDEVRYLAEPH